MSEYIYLLQEREFINAKQNIYKLGKTKQENLQRFKQYPKGSKLILQQICHDCDILETQLIKETLIKLKEKRKAINKIGKNFPTLMPNFKCSIKGQFNI